MSRTKTPPRCHTPRATNQKGGPSLASSALVLTKPPDVKFDLARSFAEQILVV